MRRLRDFDGHRSNVHGETRHLRSLPFERVDPPDDLLAEFVNDEIALPVMRADLLLRANDALSRQTSYFGLNVFGIAFELDGVVLEYNYLEGEPSVEIELENVIEIITAYSEVGN